MEKNGNMNKSLKTYDNLCKFTSLLITLQLSWRWIWKGFLHFKVLNCLPDQEALSKWRVYIHVMQPLDLEC